VRTGHTEGSIDLCKLAGFNGEAVICEIMKEDGTMARRDDLDVFAQKHDMKQIYISDLVEYRLANETLVKKVEEESSIFFNHKVIQRKFKDHLNNIHTVMQFGEVDDITHVKFHVVESDIKLFINDSKLNSMLKTINFLQAKSGILIFLENNEENKNSVKDFGVGAQILNKLNVTKLKLLTSGGKHSFVGLNGFGLEIIEEIQIEG